MLEIPFPLPLCNAMSMQKYTRARPRHNKKSKISIFIEESFYSSIKQKHLDAHRKIPGLFPKMLVKPFPLPLCNAMLMQKYIWSRMRQQQEKYFFFEN